ncbi:MAG: DUF5074 domain-containing protein [Chitinophagaceae bacterium]
MRRLFYILMGALVLLTACRKEVGVIPYEEEQVQLPGGSEASFYVLNEGNMGTNKASLDFFSRESGTYKRNIYGSVNPTATRELGDVGNDLEIYGSKLYAVINLSDKIEVMEAGTARRIGQINVRNCRFITFGNGKGYISAYGVSVGSPMPGFVAEFDTASLQITRRVYVGRQPEQMQIIGNKLYVANSGGYSPPDYERTISVIDLVNFTEISRIDVAINLGGLKKDRYNDLYVSSRGDYYNIKPKLYRIDAETQTVKDSFEIAAGSFAIYGDTAYIVSSSWSYLTNSYTTSYKLFDLQKETIINQSFIRDGTEREITIPYGLTVSPVTGNIYITDAKDYVSPGTLYCIDRITGRKLWSVVTGDIPSGFAFIP